MKSLWILGYGRLFVDTQFLLDYSRVSMRFNGVVMPVDIREGVRLLYDTLDRDYYRYTKFMNQGIGNYAYTRLKNITSDPHLIVDMPTLRIIAFSTDSLVSCVFRCHSYDHHLKKKKTYRVMAKINLENYITTVKCRVYKNKQYTYK